MTGGEWRSRARLMLRQEYEGSGVFVLGYSRDVGNPETNWYRDPHYYPRSTFPVRWLSTFMFRSVSQGFGNVVRRQVFALRKQG